MEKVFEEFQASESKVKPVLTECDWWDILKLHSTVNQCLFVCLFIFLCAEGAGGDERALSCHPEVCHPGGPGW